ncbi:MAG: RluA family pseudouridine synthase [Silvanigrellaceae bacterium]|nr:RluA family pseudouridine synthase [Silvanigrellaceae bacterium]
MENKENFIEIKVDEACHDLRLDTFLTRVFDIVPSRSFAAKLIDKGLVLVEGKERKPSFKVTKNDTIKIDISFMTQMQTSSPLAEPIDLNILHEDADILVINKPPNFVVHPGAGVTTGTLVNAVLFHCGMTLPFFESLGRAGIVHRLDKDTSGVMVVAKSQIALTELSMQFAEHTQERFYYAVVYGIPKLGEGRIETWHGRHPKERIKYAVVNEGQGKKAILNYKVEKTFENINFSLVKCQLHTGRTHQIRVQMSHLGHPIVGDLLYGHIPHGLLTRQKEILAYLRKHVERQMLHAFHLGFQHPKTRKLVNFQADLPFDFKETIAYLEKKNNDIS